MRIHLDPRTLRGMVEAILFPSALAFILVLLLLLEKWIEAGG